MTPEEEQRRFRIPERDKLEDKHAPKIERALKEQIAAIIHDGLSDLEIASAPNKLEENSTELEAALLAFVLAMSVVGVDAAQDDLQRIALGIDPAEADELAKDLARQEVNHTLRQLNSTTRKAIQAALPVWLLNAERTVNDLIKELEPQANRARANAIVTTEGTKVFRQGVAVAAGLVGITELEWYTMRDERVCPICKPMLGKRRPLNGQYDNDAPVQNPPPAHPWCRCGELMVTKSI